MERRKKEGTKVIDSSVAVLPSSNVYLTKYKSVLPGHYLDLLGTFIALDKVANEMMKSKANLTISHIDKNMLANHERVFDERIFGQILTVFPESYQYRYDKTPVKVTRHNHDRLLIVPNLEFGPVKERKSPKSPTFLSVSQMVLRRNLLTERLIDIVKAKHNEFLIKIKSINVEEIPKQKIIRWTTGFDMNSIEPIPSRSLDSTIEKEVAKPEICKELFDRSTTVTDTVGIDKPLVRKSIKPVQGKVAKQNKCTKANSIVIEDNPKSKELKDTSLNQPRMSFSLSENMKTITTSTIIKNRDSVDKKIALPKQNVRRNSDVKTKTLIQPRMSFGLNESIMSNVSAKNSPKVELIKSKVTLTNQSQLSFSLNESVKENDTQKITNILKRTEVQKTKDRFKELNQSQLSFNLNDTKSDIEDVKETPKEAQEVNRTVGQRMLPFHLKTLLKFFNMFDKSAHSYFRAGKLMYLSDILKTTSSSKSYNESHFGQLLTVCPDMYRVRWEYISNKVTGKLTSKMDIVIAPILTHGTSMSGQIIKFDSLTLKQRSQKFMDICYGIVEKCRNDYENDHNEGEPFNIDLHVDIVKSSPMPEKPILTTECDSRTKVASMTNLFSQMKQLNSTRQEDTTKISIPCSDKLKSVPLSILERVRQNKANKHLFHKVEGDVKKRMILERLPRLVRIMITEFKKNDTLQKSHITKMVCESLEIRPGDFDEHIRVLNEMVPGYIVCHNWTTPCLKLGTSKMTLTEIIDKLSL